jgi:uncharacterized protein YgbK (DUF1537 family)
VVKTFEYALIVADDFTGANDTAAQFAKLGFDAVTTLKLDETHSLLRQHDIVAIDTESRATRADKAYRILFSLGEKIRNHTKNLLVYKKMDSTLRGNVVPEIQALLDSLEPDLIVFAPAYPKQGRTTRNGVQMLEGVPLEQTYFGKDIRTPVVSSNIPMLFSPVFGDCYHHFSLDDLRSGRICEKIGDKRILSFDIENDKDMETVVKELKILDKDRTIVWVGSTGLAEPLAHNLVFGRRTGKPVLIAVGSANDLTRRQMQVFVREFETMPVLVNVKNLIGEYENESKRVIKEVSRKLGNSSDVIVTTSYDPEQIREGKGLTSELALSPLEFGSRLANTFGRLISSLIDRFGRESFSGLFMTGGDTAVSVISHLGIDELEVEGEIDSAIPILKYRDLQMVTKAGGFGTLDAIVKIVARLKMKR